MTSTPTPKELRWLEWCVAGARLFSTCSRRQYMALVLSPNGRVVGTGYNGSPPGLPHCVDGGCPRAVANTSPHGAPYADCLAVHAEGNALLWSDRTAREGGTLYVNGPPCWDCAKLIAGSGIRRVVHTPDDAYADFERVASLLADAGVELVSGGVERDALSAPMLEMHRCLVDVLVYHWATSTSGCGCGWRKLGASWPEHVADVFFESWAARQT